MYFIWPGRRTFREMGAVVILRSLGIFREGPLNPPKGDFEDSNYLMKHLFIDRRNISRKDFKTRRITEKSFWLSGI